MFIRLLVRHDAIPMYQLFLGASLCVVPLTFPSEILRLGCQVRFISPEMILRLHVMGGATRGPSKLETLSNWVKYLACC